MTLEDGYYDLEKSVLYVLPQVGERTLYPQSNVVLKRLVIYHTSILVFIFILSVCHVRG